MSEEKGTTKVEERQRKYLKPLDLISGLIPAIRLQGVCRIRSQANWREGINEVLRYINEREDLRVKLNVLHPEEFKQIASTYCLLEGFMSNSDPRQDYYKVLFNRSKAGVELDELVQEDPNFTAPDYEEMAKRFIEGIKKKD